MPDNILAYKSTDIIEICKNKFLQILRLNEKFFNISAYGMEMPLLTKKL